MTTTSKSEMQRVFERGGQTESTTERLCQAVQETETKLSTIVARMYLRNDDYFKVGALMKSVFSLRSYNMSVLLGLRFAPRSTKAVQRHLYLKIKFLPSFDAHEAVNSYTILVGLLNSVCDTINATADVLSRDVQMNRRLHSFAVLLEVVKDASRRGLLLTLRYRSAFTLLQRDIPMTWFQYVLGVHCQVYLFRCGPSRFFDIENAYRHVRNKQRAAVMDDANDGLEPGYEPHLFAIAFPDGRYLCSPP